MALRILLAVFFLVDLVVRGAGGGPSGALHVALVVTACLCAAFIAGCFVFKAAGGEPERLLDGAGTGVTTLVTLLLVPWSAVATLSLLVGWALSGESFADEVVPSLRIGRLPMPWDRARVEALGVDSVLNLCVEFGDLSGLGRAGVATLRVPVLYGTAPSMDRLERAAEWCRERLEAGGSVLVHCAHGHGRSAVAAAAVLLATERAADPEEALRCLRAARPGVKLSGRQRAAVEQFHARRLARAGAA